MSVLLVIIRVIGIIWIRVLDRLSQSLTILKKCKAFAIVEVRLVGWLWI